MAKRYFLCQGCRTRVERVKRKCPVCGRARPKKRVPKHAITLQRDSYDFYCQIAADIHGVTDERCCVCGKPRNPERRHDRDHDHLTGNPRGLACVVCNKLMVHKLTLERARQIVGYLERVEKHYTKPKSQEGQVATEGSTEV